MWSEARLSWPSRLLVLALVSGFVIVTIGFVAYHQANLPVPPNTPYDPDFYYARQLAENNATLTAGLGIILIVASMVFLGLVGRELNPQVRRALLIGAGVILIGFAVLFAQPYYSRFLG
jgi:hypothetical protein